MSTLQHSHLVDTVSDFDAEEQYSSPYLIRPPLLPEHNGLIRQVVL